MLTELSRPKAVIFDKDGTLLDTELPARNAWLGAAKELQLPIYDEHIDQLTGRNSRDIQTKLLGILENATVVDQFRSLSLELYKNELAQGFKIKPGAREIIDTFSELRIPMLVATSSSKSSTEAQMKSIGFFERLTHIVGGDEVTHGKPHPEIFLKAANHVDQDPSDCWVFEDTPLGVEGANAAGMVTFMVPDLIKPTEKCHQRAKKILGTLHDGVALIKGFLS